MEAYASEHPEPIEELMNWPATRFEAMYEAYLKRVAVREATQIKHAMISGVWSNTNFDDEKNSRTKALQQIEEQHQETIRQIYSRIDREEQIAFESDPFFAAMNLPREDSP